MLVLFGSNPESAQIVDLPHIKPEYQVRVNLGSMLEKAHCDIASSIRVNKSVLNDATVHLLLLVFL